MEEIVIFVSVGMWQNRLRLKGIMLVMSSLFTGDMLFCPVRLSVRLAVHNRVRSIFPKRLEGFS